MRLPRLTLRRLMLLEAALALGLGTDLWMRRRDEAFRRRSAYDA